MVCATGAAASAAPICNEAAAFRERIKSALPSCKVPVIRAPLPVPPLLIKIRPPLSAPISPAVVTEFKKMVPSLRTLNLLTLPTCKSANSEAAALVVSVALNFNPVNVVATLFQVCVAFSTGVLAVWVAPVSVSAVDPTTSVTVTGRGMAYPSPACGALSCGVTVSSAITSRFAMYLP